MVTPFEILGKVDPFKTPITLLADIPITTLSKGSTYSTVLTASFDTSYLYCITRDSCQNKWPLRCIEVRINGRKLDLKREGTPVLVPGEKIEMGE